MTLPSGSAADARVSSSPLRARRASARMAAAPRADARGARGRGVERPPAAVDPAQSRAVPVGVQPLSRAGWSATARGRRPEIRWKQWCWLTRSRTWRWRCCARSRSCRTRCGADSVASAAPSPGESRAIGAASRCATWSCASRNGAGRDAKPSPARISATSCAAFSIDSSSGTRRCRACARCAVSKAPSTTKSIAAPVILLAPHFAGCDAGGARMFFETPIVSMYARQKNRVFDAAMRRGRTRLPGASMVLRTDGLRAAVRALRAGTPFYFLPDMDLGSREALFVPSSACRQPPSRRSRDWRGSRCRRRSVRDAHETTATSCSCIRRGNRSPARPVRSHATDERLHRAARARDAGAVPVEPSPLQARPPGEPSLYDGDDQR